MDFPFFLNQQKHYTLLKSETLVHLNQFYTIFLPFFFTDDAFHEALLGIGSIFMYEWVLMMEYARAPS